jgi:hypothetical protein
MAAILNLNEYKTFLGLQSTNNDVQYEAYIEAVNEYISQYCNRAFYTTDQEQALNFSVKPGDELQPIFLPEFNLLDGFTFTNNVSALPLVEYTDFYYDERANTLVPITPYPVGKNSLTLLGTLGFSIIPLDLKLAATELVNNYFKREGAKKASNATTPTVFDSIEGGQLPQHIKRILIHYTIRN